MSRRGGNAPRRADRGECHRGCGGARGDPGGAHRREARGARQQGDAGDGGRAGHPHGARGGRGDRAGRLGAQRRAAARHRAAAGGAGPAHPDGVGRAVPHLDGGARGGRHRGRSAAPPHLEDGEEDHGRFRHARQQGARGDRGALPVPPAVRRGGGGGASPVGGARLRRVRGRLRAGPGGIPHDGAADSLRSHSPAAHPGRGHAPVRSGGGGDAHVRARVPRALSGVPVGARGGGGVQRGQRGSGRAVSRGQNPLRQDRRDDRSCTGWAPGGRCRDARGGAGRRRGGAPAGAGGRVPLTLAAFIVVIGVLIFIHEAGHFVVAKVVGIQVLRFSLGFGRPILRWRRGETEYWISWIPFGGYVKMAGLEDEGMAGELEGGASAEPIDPARAFDKKPVAVRLMVVCAGVAMNALLAFVIFAVLAGSVGTPELNTTRIDSVVTTRLPAGARALASLAPGDRIVRVNDDTIRTWDDVVRQIVSGPAELTFQVAGRAEPLMIDLGQGGLAARQAVADALVPEVPVVVQRLEEGRPGGRARPNPGAGGGGGPASSRATWWSPWTGRRYDRSSAFSSASGSAGVGRWRSRCCAAARPSPSRSSPTRPAAWTPRTPSVPVPTASSARRCSRV